MLTIDEIRNCNTAFMFWTNNALSKTIESCLGDAIIKRSAEGKNKIIFVVRAGGINTMIECLYRRFVPLQKRMEIVDANNGTLIK